MRFRYYYVGLPALDAEAYAASESPLGVALAPLMDCPRERRPDLAVEALERVVAAPGLNDFQRHLLADCVVAYAPFDDEQKRQFGEAISRGRPMGVIKAYNKTWFEEGYDKGVETGVERGRQLGRRELVRALIEARFGPLPEAAARRFDELSADQLRELGLKLTAAASLQDLGLSG